jgi:hypothetical protein
LLVHCLKKVVAPRLSTNNVLIQGGESITGITASWVALASNPPPSPLTTSQERDYFTSLPDAANVLVIRTNKAGDFSRYKLRLVNSVLNAATAQFEITEVLNGFDTQLAEVRFSFKVDCPSTLDCAPLAPICPPDAPTPPPINYLAKDYGSFCSIMQDRLNQLLPNWGGTSEADLGVALTELISYVGDHLSYQQDAIATEAYLETARSRVSLRRHAVLVDYTVHDGCNARAWIHLEVTENLSKPVLGYKNTRFYTTAPGMPSSLKFGSGNEAAALISGVQVFEPMEDFKAPNLDPRHNRMFFHTWGDTNCCLPRGATEATLRGSFPNLQAGDVLIFQEVLGPQTGNAADADIRHRCAVRLTLVYPGPHDPPLFDPLTLDCHRRPIHVTEIQWSQDDALPFPLCISSTYLDNNNSQVASNVSVALGNIVLADHGLTIADKPVGSVPESTLSLPPDPGGDRCKLTPPTPLPIRFRPRVPQSPVTQVVDLSKAGTSTSAMSMSAMTGVSASATRLMNFDPKDALPFIFLTGTRQGGLAYQWDVKQDLLENGESDRVFVMEVEDDGTATLRFGDDTNGATPDAGTDFTATYRIGNGIAGNVGADTLLNLVTAVAGIRSCTNPLPATGGTDPETMDQIRRRAPQGFLTPVRAVTMTDYENAVEQNPQVEQAVATLRWTGSWYTVFIAVQPVGGGNLSQSLQQTLESNLRGKQLSGLDLQLDSPQYLSLEIELQVCVDPNYFQSDVQRSLLQVLGNQILPNGQKGLFYPDNFTFGQTVYLSPVYKAARSVAGVASVTATKFQPQGVNTGQYLAAGEIKLGSLQVARLENDPSLPNHGQLTLEMVGGK